MVDYLHETNMVKSHIGFMLYDSDIHGGDLKVKLDEDIKRVVVSTEDGIEIQRYKEFLVQQTKLGIEHYLRYTENAGQY